ncbi:helix-turn-helix domain-containing protein [Rhodovulum steppense]|uniref:Transcriptional regulator with XRE-family HTH domain n=1 Tax=Rhodovulum steppense TaxID=540251 RepID=A0A4R1YNG6_9RHOB|nr:helix-turn-helix transcriptional regulator [Rhodovulum steppense]TCM79650.1 transcriptional regulator with XRE-family HTH domain [Rhodovulum steppense]
MDQDLSARLRDLKEAHGWTAKEMGEMIGIPKRTMESYMRPRDAAYPGVDALRKLATGLGVSLDWLVFGAECAGRRSASLAKLVTLSAAREVLPDLFQAIDRVDDEPLEEQFVGGRTAGEWAEALATIAAERAFNVASLGATSEALEHFERRFELKAALERLQTFEALKAKKLELEAQIAELRADMGSDSPD